MITVPLYYTASSSSSSTASPSSSTAASLITSLPITIATVPYTCPLPPQLQILLPSYQDSQGNRLASEMPIFLNQHIGESPLPSPRSVFLMEDSSNWFDPDRCSVSPMMEYSSIDWPIVPSLSLDTAIPSTITTPTSSNGNIQSQQDESGYLMVPGSSSGSGGSSMNGISNERRRYSSNSSNSSNILSPSGILTNEYNIQINESNPTTYIGTIT